MHTVNRYKDKGSYKKSYYYFLIVEFFSISQHNKPVVWRQREAKLFLQHAEKLISKIAPEPDFY